MSFVRTLNQDTLSSAETEDLFARQEWSAAETLDACQSIVEAVRERGDSALLEFTERFDGVTLTTATLRVSAEEIDQAESRLPPPLREALDRAIANIERFHRTQLERGMSLTEVESGVWCGERTTPIDSACLYVPRGRGAFSSVACMLAVPAKLANVDRVIVCTPPGSDGSVDAATLYALKQIGIDEIYRVGGAQAIAAVAYGTETIPRCAKVVGPGNVYVSGARQILASRIDPGPPAGPSESLVLADGWANVENVAWNLMIEAEHGENSSAWLLTDCEQLATDVAETVERLLPKLTQQRQEYVREVLTSRGGIIVCKDLTAVARLANQYAAEHVALMVREPWGLLPQITNAGEILLGDYPIMSLANYAMGINAILPTGGRAQTYSGVSVRDFTKISSIGYLTKQGFESLSRFVPTLSRDEGFSAHHEAILGWRQS
jgi:histidinol dehydrogenase